MSQAEGAVPPRPSLLRRLVGESAIYGLGGVANQAVAILLVPIYARALGVTNYGTVAILTTTLSLATLVATLGLPQAFFRSYLKEADDDRQRDHVLRTSIGLRLVVSALALVLFLAVSLPLSTMLIGAANSWLLMALIGPILFFDTLNLVPLSFLRAQRRPIPYAALSFVRAVLGSAVIVVLVVVLDQGVLGVLLGSVVASATAAFAGLLILQREDRLRLGFDRRLVRHMLVFSLPLVPAAVAGWTLNLSDRYIVAAVEGTRSVGLYSAGYTVGLAINALAVAPFTLAWGATYWELAKQPGTRQAIARVMTGYLAIASFAALGLSALATDIFRVLLTPDFEPGRFVTPFSAFAYVLYGAFTVATTGLNLESQTRKLPGLMGVAAVANLLLNLALVPLVGYLGAAVSTVVSYGLLAVTAGWVSQRAYPVPWQLGRGGLLLGIALGLAAAALLGPDHVGWRLACIAAYPVLVLGLRILPTDALRPLIDRLRRRAG